MKKIKTGIASYGLSGQVFHAPFIHVHGGFELTAICERSRNLARERYPDVTVVRSFEELLAQDVELVIVNTPDTTHYEYCRKALEAGKHVVVEKPFVFTEAEALELISLAVSRNLLITVYQNRRFDGDFLTVQAVMESGMLGRIVELRSDFQRYRPAIAPGTWKEQADTETDRRVGITYNLCSHLCDQALVLFGKPQGIWARLAVQRDGGRIDDYSYMELIYPEVIVSLRAGMLIREEGPRFALHGTQGSYVKYGLDPQEAALKSGFVPPAEEWGFEPESDWGVLHTDEGRVKFPTVTGNYIRYYDNIFKVLRENAPALVSHSDMIADIRMLEAAFESHRTGNTVGI